MSKKVLFISKVYTHPIDMGNCWETLAQTMILKKLGCEVDFLYVQEKGLNRKDSEMFERQYVQTKEYWGENFFYLEVGKIEKIIKNCLSIFRKHFCGGHEGVYDKYPFFLTSFVKNLQKTNNYDVCYVNYYYLTKLFKKIKFEKMACLTHDVIAYKNLKVNERSYWIDAHQEAKAMQLCTDLFAVQEEEANYFKILSPNSHIYNIYSQYEYNATAPTNNKNIVFLSGNNGFNQNGLKWFVKDVFPLIRTAFPDSKLIIAGGICKVIKGQYDDVEGIELMGYVDNPIDLYKLGDVAINPVYQGTGLKIKTFEAIAYGKVTLVHPHSMAGVFDKQNAPLFASTHPEEWVKFLGNIWNHPDEIDRIKQKDEEYLKSMDEFVISEYKRFLKV